ncbi:hypothetical protein BU23DRAFT_586552 [Bimuria novae-zelandiae CBS 107.79]|uniref:GST N-terminal domain-containing protein n=1 Tax=Bimuria novae-zelandiae CBS 107.79 TaxID=1447943 RepID=A0A6A5VPM0_9PLEO|nr:hypothetical protein BU23DRAFT_586552 [Bimuria novae-zelandiae CBS 107.79]
MPPSTNLPVLLFGYDSSPFTNKVRLALRLKQIHFSYIPVPSMLPRPLLTTTFALPYRKIPILLIGKDLYCDTSLILEALEHFFPPTHGFPSLHPPIPGWNYAGLARGIASFWLDRPFFRITTGLIPPSVWRSHFGTDRAQLIGHALDPDKLAAKIPANLSALDAQLALLELSVSQGEGKWVFPTKEPGLVDIAVYYQLKWGVDIASGKGVYNLSGGRVGEAREGGTEVVFNERRYPGLWKWFKRFEESIGRLSDRESVVEEGDVRWKYAIRSLSQQKGLGLVPTTVGKNGVLDEKRGLVPGTVVSVVPDDTGRGNPTIGRLMDAGVEEVIIKPIERGEVDVDIHFPRVGFVIKVMQSSKL